MKKIFWIALFGAVFAGASALAVETRLTREAMIRELDFIGDTFSTQYAPADWKKSYTNWDVWTEINRAKSEVDSKKELTLGSYQQSLLKYFSSMRDYHVAVIFDSTEIATLPFTVKGVNGKYFLAYIDRTKLPESAFPFQPGDELVKFGDQSAADAVSALLPSTIATQQTDQALAELTLTRRRAARGYAVPRGPVMLTLLRQGTEEPVTRQLIWDYTPEKIAGRERTVTDSLTQMLGEVKVAGQPQSDAFHPQMVSPVAQQFEAATPADPNPFNIGNRKSYVPALGTKIWESDEKDVFHAYIYRAPDNRVIGYVRIPSYAPADKEAAVKAFRKVVGLFETSTDAMVIDEINNPGGSVFYLYSLASMLSDQALSSPRHRMAITTSDVADAATTLDQLASVTNDEEARKVLGETSDGFPVTYEYVQFTREFAQFIISEYQAGKRLTSPYWIAGADHINPDPVHYTKPILLLTNSLDFSGGDFFPATLQDNKRVTILGTRTAGAGGYILHVQYPNAFGINMFSVTGSIAERANLNPIENLGVTPDIEYSITERDLREGFADYKAAINAGVAGLFNKK